MQIFRFRENGLGTWGKFTWLSAGFECFTFEPAGPDTIARGLDRRIPQGVYNIRWHWSGMYNKPMPNLFNDIVPIDRYILIHSGNYADDTLGCILLGATMGENGVFSSKKVFNPFYEMLKQVPMDENKILAEKLQIINEF